MKVEDIHVLSSGTIVTLNSYLNDQEVVPIKFSNVSIWNISFDDDSNILTFKQQTKLMLEIDNLVIDNVWAGGIGFSPGSIESIF